MERILVAVSPKAPPDNPTITGIMALAAEGLFYHKKILDINAGDVSTDCKYVGENIYAAVVTDQDEPRLAFFDFSTGVEPFLVVGAKSYDPRLEGKDVNYFYPIVDNAVLAFSGFKR